MFCCLVAGPRVHFQALRDLRAGVAPESPITQEEIAEWLAAMEPYPTMNAPLQALRASPNPRRPQLLLVFEKVQGIFAKLLTTSWK